VLRRLLLRFAILTLGYVCLPAMSAVRPESIAVIYNTNEPMSLAVAQYYCSKAGVPTSHMLGVSAQKDVDYQVNPPTVDNYDGPNGIATLIQNALLNSGLGVTADNWANDPIQVLVMCYGMPFRVGYSGVVYSLDSFLTTPFSPNCGPENRAWVANPYLGRNMEFSVARASGLTSFYGGRMRYLVCRLDMYDDVIDTLPSGQSIPH
jgi:uncharacterized protein (TIGR03790 family)